MIIYTPDVVVTCNSYRGLEASIYNLGFVLVQLTPRVARTRTHGVGVLGALRSLERGHARVLLEHGG